MERRRSFYLLKVSFSRTSIFVENSYNSNSLSDSITRQLINAILRDDSNVLGELLANIDSPNFTISLTSSKLPFPLDKNPYLIHFAAFFGSISCFELLIDSDANLDTFDTFGRSILHFAFSGGRMDIIRRLDQISIVDFEQKDLCLASPVEYACIFGHIHVIQYAWQKGVQLTNEMLNLSCEYGHFELSQFLINLGVTPTEETYMCAAIGGNPENIKLLSNYSFNISTAFYKATEYGFLDCVKLLYSQGYSFRSRPKFSPVEIALIAGHLQIVKFFIEDCHVPVAYTNSIQETPIMLAAQNGHTSIFNYLVSQGATVSLNTANAACLCGKYSIVAAVGKHLQFQSSHIYTLLSSCRSIRTIKYAVQHSGTLNSSLFVPFCDGYNDADLFKLIVSKDFILNEDDITLTIVNNPDLISSLLSAQSQCIQHVTRLLCMVNNPESAKILIDFVQTNKKKVNMLKIARSVELNDEMAEVLVPFLLQSSGEIIQQNVIKSAVKNNSTKSLEMISQYHPNFNIPDIIENDLKDESVVAFLLDHGLEANSLLANGKQLLSLTQPIDVFTLLLNRGADPSPLLLDAIFYRKYDYARELVEHGANLAQVTKAGFSPLQFSCIDHDGLYFVRILIRNGADVDYQNPMQKNETALGVAIRHGNIPAAKSILRHGVQISCMKRNFIDKYVKKLPLDPGEKLIKKNGIMQISKDMF